MSATSSDLQLDNENSYSSRTKGGTEKDRKNTTNWENGKRSSSNSKSETRSISSKYDDKSEHFERLLRESQQHVCNRDAIIDMLQKQLKRIEELYRKTLNQQQDIRQKYANVVLELTRLKVICDQLKTENSTLSRANEETTRRYRYEREGLQDELNTWRQEYDQLVRTINNMEKNTTIMKDILYSDDSYHQQILNGTYVEQLLEQYKQIQEALVVQNDKLDRFLEKFHLIGDGGCSIVRSLEGVRCIGKMHSKSLSSIVPDRPKSPGQPEQTPIYAIRRPETRRRSETPPPDVSNDYYINGSMCCHEVSIRGEESKRPLMKMDEIIQTDSHSSVCCVNMPPMLLESTRQANFTHSCCEGIPIVPEKFRQTSYLAEAPYLIANECLQTCSCSTSDASCCLELTSPPVVATEAVQTGPSCESVSDIIPSPIFTTDLAVAPESDGNKSVPSPCSRSCCVSEIATPHSLNGYCVPNDTQNTVHRIETAMQTESVCESICNAQEKPLSFNTHSPRDHEVVLVHIVPREIAVQTSSVFESVCSTLQEKIPSNLDISEIMPPRLIFKEKTNIFSNEKQPAKGPISRDSKSAGAAVVFIETVAKTGSSSENFCSFPQRKVPPSSCTGDAKIPMSSAISLDTAAKFESIPASPYGLSKKQSSTSARSACKRELKPIFVGTAAPTKSIPKDSLPGQNQPSSSPYSSRATSEPVQQNTTSLPRERTFISNYSKSAPTSAVSCETQTMMEVNQDELNERYANVETHWYPPSTTIETGTSPCSHIHFFPEMHTPVAKSEASQTESSCRTNCIFSENMAPVTITTMEEVTQTVPITAPPTKEETSQTESTCRGSCAVSDRVPSIVNVEEITQTVSIVEDSYTAPILLFPPQTTEEASQTESTFKDSYTSIDKAPSIMTVEEVTQTVTFAALSTIEKAVQTESTCTLSDEAPSFTSAEEFTQTVSIVGDSYTAPKVMPHIVTIEEASQTESLSRDSCTVSDKEPFFKTVEEVTQTVSIAAPSTIEHASQTESSCSTVEEIIQTVSTVRDRYTAPEVIHPALTVEEASQTVSVAGDGCIFPEISPAIAEKGTQTVSIGQITTGIDMSAASRISGLLLSVEETTQTAPMGQICETDKESILTLCTIEESTQTALIGKITISSVQSDFLPSATVPESTQTVSIDQITTDTGTSSTYLSNESIITVEGSTQTAPIGKITTDTAVSVSSVQSGFLPAATVPKSTQTVSIDQITADIGTSSTYLSNESIVTVEESTQTAPIGKITTDTAVSVSSLQSGFVPSATVPKSTQTVSIAQITAGTGTSSTYLSNESIVTVEESTQTAPIGKITIDTAVSVSSLQGGFLPSAIVPKSTQTVSIDQVTVETSASPTYLSRESIITIEESTQTASIRQIIREICASFPSISVEEPTQTESDLYSICAIPEVVPPPVSIGELGQGARPIPEQQDRSVWVLPESANEATQIDISSTSASIQTDGRPSTHIDSHKFGISIETQTVADESTQTLNLECTDCCTETELQLDFVGSRKLISCRKRSKSNQISRRPSAASCEEQELRICCFCDDISLTVKPETTDKAICTDILDSGDGGLLAENERLQQLLLMKELTIKRLQDERSLEEEVLVEKQRLQDENVALKQDLANIEGELKWLRKKLADVGQEINASENGKDHYISETNDLLNEYEASLQELNQKYASAIKENQSLTEEVAVLIEQVNFLNETINQHKEQASLCKLQLENMTEKVKELEDTIRELEQQKELILDSSNNMDELNPALQELTEQCELLKEENESLLEYNKEVLLLKKKNSNLVHEIDTKDVAIDELQGRIEELQKELDSVKEEMESNNETAKEEMDKLIQVCNELEQKLETTKELLEKEVTSMDEEVNASLGPYNERTDEALQKKIDEKTKQLQKAKEELENVKDNFEEEISKLDAKNALLQLQLGKEQLDHQREIETIEEKLTQCHKEYVSAVVSCSDIESSNSSTATSELTSLLEECVEKNKRLHEELRTCREQIKNLQQSGKECGLLKAENMKFKVQISALQRQLAEMKDVEEKLKQLNHEKEELIVKVKYLEKQLAISRCRCERAKKPPLCLDPIKEETTQRPCTPMVPKPKAPCCPCSQKKDHTHITLAASCVNKANTNPPTDTDNIVTRKDSQIGGALGTLNLRLASINRMEGQIDQMITSVHRQNQKMNACNLSKFQSDKDIKECLSNLRHKREQLMSSLNKFKRELTVFECKTKARVCNCPKSDNPT